MLQAERILLILLIAAAHLAAADTWQRVHIAPDGPSFLVPVGAEAASNGQEWVYRPPHENWADDLVMVISPSVGLYNNLNVRQSFDYAWKDDLEHFSPITWKWKGHNSYVWVERDGRIKRFRKLFVHPTDPEHHPIRSLTIQYSRGRLHQYDRWLEHIEGTFVAYP